MEIEKLRVFCDLADCHSFSKAAEKNMLSQSAVSQQLAQLETTFKTQLLDRRKRPFKLTEAGQMLYYAARDIIERYESFQLELETVKLSKQNLVRVGAIFSVGMHSLQGYIKKFIEKFSNANLKVSFHNTDEIHEMVLKGQMDIGVVVATDDEKNIESFGFELEPLLFVCSPQHQLANESYMDIRKLQGQPFIAFEQGLPSEKIITEMLKKYSIKVDTVMEFDNIETIKRAIEINSGVSILPEPAIRKEMTDGSLKAKLFSNERFVRPTSIIVNKRRKLSSEAKYLLELLHKKI
jgi:DNA-binding transcriptional LysR family regulator